MFFFINYIKYKFTTLRFKKALVNERASKKKYDWCLIMLISKRYLRMVICKASKDDRGLLFMCRMCRTLSLLGKSLTKPLRYLFSEWKMIHYLISASSPATYCLTWWTWIHFQKLISLQPPTCQTEWTRIGLHRDSIWHATCLSFLAVVLVVFICAVPCSIPQWNCWCVP